MIGPQIGIAKRPVNHNGFPHSQGRSQMFCDRTWAAHANMEFQAFISRMASDRIITGGKICESQAHVLAWKKRKS